MIQPLPYFQELTRRGPVSADTTPLRSLAPDNGPVFYTRHQLGQIPSADVVIVMAHPDDENYVAGTAAKLMAEGQRVLFVYATSGDAGTDISGQNIPTGKPIAHTRERNLKEALSTFNTQVPTAVLRFPDSRVGQYAPYIGPLLQQILQTTQPKVVLTFGPDGMSGHPDHIALGKVVDQAVQSMPQRISLYHVVPSEESVQTYGASPYESTPAPNGQTGRNRLLPAVTKPRVDVRIPLEAYQQMIHHQALRAHANNFYTREINHYETWKEQYPFEEFERVI